MTMDVPEGSLYAAIEKYSKLETLDGYLSAYKTSQSLSTQGYIQRACAFNLGALQISLKKYEEGLKHLDKAIPPDGKRDGTSNGDLFFNFGLGYEGLKDAHGAKKYFQMALDEYRTEPANIQMEATTVNKLGHLHLAEHELSEAEKCLSELIDLYSKLGDLEKKMQANIEKASVHLAMKEASHAKEIADACVENLNSAKPSIASAKHYTDLAVIYTQLVLYEKAIAASMKALEIMDGQIGQNNPNNRLLSILYQNLGAIYNFNGQFEMAIEYHQKAIQEFAKAKERVFQGHCFTNMGFAYSQLKNMEKAKECFLHGLQAAKEGDDLKSQWENLEALACVSFHEKRPDKAEEYLKEALSVFPKSRKSDHTPSSTSDKVWNRLNRKYRESIELQIQAKAVAVISSNKALRGQGREGDLYTDSDRTPGEVKEIRRGSKVKYLKVRRSGTLRRFNKVALGLDPRASIMEDGEKSSSGDSSSGSSSEESGSEKEEKSEGSKEKQIDENDQRKESQRPLGGRPPDSYLPQSAPPPKLFSDMESGVSEELEVEESSNDSDEDSKNVKANMRQYLSLEPDEPSITQRQVQADVHAQEEESENSEEEEEETDDESSSESLSPAKPPVPSLSPHPTNQNIRTYETVGGKKQEFGSPFLQDKPPRGPGMGSNAPKTGEADFAGASGIYDSIKSTKNSNDGAYKDSKDSDGNELISEEETEKLSRAERDVVLYGQFKSDMDKKNTAEDADSADMNMGDEKKSKSCILM